MKVFIENEAGSDQKNLYNEKTLEYRKTVTVSRKYPYPYGFIIDTTSGDGDNLDVFVITNKKLKRGQIVECDPVGLMEQVEKSWDKSKNDVEEIDHNILAVLIGEKQNVINKEVKDYLTDFVLHVFDHIRKNKNRIGNFLDKKEAIRYIEKCKDK
ncbi:MAG: inorganic diphosphatase [Promethearchaeota archaeon]